ncbi:hypothetical protein, partial [Klebsiella pneumoniae]
QILNALRAHDDRFNAKVNSIALNEKVELPIDVQPVPNPKPDDKPADDDPATTKKKLNASDDSPTGQSENSSEQELTAEQMTLFSLEAWQ